MISEPPPGGPSRADGDTRPGRRRGRLSGGSKVWLAFTGILLAFGLAGLIFPPEQPERQGSRFPAFDLQGHRGARGLEPENSLPAIRAALTLGVTTLELDLGLTQDRVLVVHHDRRLDPERTRGPDGAWLVEPTPVLFELPRTQLAGYDIGRAQPGSRVARRFPDQNGHDGIAIPTLGEAFDFAEARSAGAIWYNLEIKTSPLEPDQTAHPGPFAQALAAAVTRAGVADRVMVQSFDWRALARFQELAPDVPTVYLTAEESWLDNLQRGQPGVSPWTAELDVDDFEGSVPRAVKAAGGAVWSPYYRNLRAAELREAHGVGLRVVVWTVNDPAEMASLIDLGVDGIITDYPDRLRRVMAEKALPLPPGYPDN